MLTRHHFTVCTNFVSLSRTFETVTCQLCLSLKKKKETKLKRAKQDLYYLGGFCKTLKSQAQDRDLVEENM